MISYGHVDEIYKIIETKLGLPKRVVRWYVTIGLIPQPERNGRKSFYDLKKTNLLDRLRAIKLLQNDFKYQLEDIKGILDKVAGEDIGTLLTNLECLIKDYPLYVPIKIFSHKKKMHVKKKVIEAQHALIWHQFLSQLEKGTLNFKTFNLLELIRAIKRMTLDAYDEYYDSNLNYRERYARWHQ